MSQKRSKNGSKNPVSSSGSLLKKRTKHDNDEEEYSDLDKAIRKEEEELNY